MAPSTPPSHLENGYLYCSIVFTILLKFYIFKLQLTGILHILHPYILYRLHHMYIFICKS